MRLRPQTIQNEKPLLWLGLAILAVLAVFAVLFARERLYGDSAIYLFWMTQTEDFQILHLRPSSYFTQWLPLLAMKSGATMQTVIQLHSFSEWLLMAGTFILIAVRLKQVRLGIAMLMAILIGSRWNYFNPVSELLTGLPFFFLMFALLLSERKTLITYILCSLLLVFTIFNHMLFSLMVPLFGAWLWLVGRVSARIFWIGLVITIVAGLVHYLVMDSYDQGSIKADEGIREGFDRIRKFGFAAFLKNELKFKWVGLVMSAAVLWALWKQKRILAAVLFGGSTIGLTLLVIFKYGGYFPETYEPFERYLFPVSAFAAFAFMMTRPVQKPGRELFFLAFAALFQLVVLHRYGAFVTKRFDFLDHALDYTIERGVPKLAFRAENYYTDPLGHNWTMLNESVLMTSAKYNKQTAQVFVYEYFQPGEVDQLPEDELLWAPYAGWTLKIDELNPNYFNMQKGPLLIANTDSIQRFRGPQWFDKIQIEAGRAESTRPGAKTRLPLTIINGNAEPLTSGMRKERIVLYTAWIDEKGNSQLHTETTMIADVHTRLTQPVKMQVPPANHQWTFTAGLYLADSLLIPLRVSAVK